MPRYPHHLAVQRPSGDPGRRPVGRSHGTLDGEMADAHTPEEVGLTAFLVHALSPEPHDPWHDLPARKRVRRVRSSNRAGSFMGSEFVDADRTNWDAEGHPYRDLRGAPCRGGTSPVMARVASTAGTGRRRQGAWHRRDDDRTGRVEPAARRRAQRGTLAHPDEALSSGRSRCVDTTNRLNHPAGAGPGWNGIASGLPTGLGDRDVRQTDLRRAP